MADTATTKQLLHPVFGGELEIAPMQRLLDPATAAPQN
jgi:hypothetical protein